MNEQKRIYRKPSIREAIVEVLPSNWIEYQPGYYEKLKRTMGFMHAIQYDASFDGMTTGQIHTALLNAGYTYSYGVVVAALTQLTRSQVVIDGWKVCWKKGPRDSYCVHYKV